MENAMVINDNYKTTGEIADILNTTPQQIAKYGRDGRLVGAEKKGGKWIFRADTVLVPSETITQKILNYVDGLSDEEKHQLYNEWQ